MELDPQTVFGQKIGLAKMPIFSQVVLSLPLSFAAIPLVLLTSNRQKMGKFANPPLAYGTGLIDDVGYRLSKS